MAEEIDHVDEEEFLLFYEMPIKKKSLAKEG